MQVAAISDWPSDQDEKKNPSGFFDFRTGLLTATMRREASAGLRVPTGHHTKRRRRIRKDSSSSERSVKTLRTRRSQKRSSSS
jgi:hypothetical protein